MTVTTVGNIRGGEAMQGTSVVRHPHIIFFNNAGFIIYYVTSGT